MNFHVLKPNRSNDVFEGPVWSLFEVDSFNKELTLSRESIITILDYYSGNLDPLKVELEVDVAKHLYLSMGGSKETPANEIVAFMFVLLRTPNYKYEDYLHKMLNACYIDTVFRYFSELEISAPYQYILSLKSLINDDTLYRVLSARYEFSVDTESSTEEHLEFLKGLMSSITAYFQGGSETLDFINTIINN